MKAQHAALNSVLQEPLEPALADAGSLDVEHVTSPSLARALAVGCLSRLDPDARAVNIWDPAAGSGLAGGLVVDALRSAGVDARYRGQDINDAAVSTARRRFEAVPDADVAVGDTLSQDAFEDFVADLVIVDAPWGMSWGRSASAVEARRGRGEFGFGLPQRSDSTWLFISLALEKLRPLAGGGGRVAALVNPGALSAAGSGTVRRKIVEAGLLESVTRLPEGLAPVASIPLYLLTFASSAAERRRGKAMIADLQTLFTTERRQRSMPISAFQELESGLRTFRPGPRNRIIAPRQFIRRDALLGRRTGDGHRLSWRTSTYDDTEIDESFLEARYGSDVAVSLVELPREVIDLDPSRIFGDDTRELLGDMAAKGWPGRRLSRFLHSEPKVVSGEAKDASDGQIFIPATRFGVVTDDPNGVGLDGRVLSIRLDQDRVQPSFLAAWLNSEQGALSRRRAIEVSSSGPFIHALRSDSRSLMRWADELIVPEPDRKTQLTLAQADERLGSFQADLSVQRASIWVTPAEADDVVDRIAHAFDHSLSSWLDQLPFPIASALWTAETAASPSEKQRAYMHAWEAIVTFHATVLLSVSRSDPGGSREVEAMISQTLQEHHLDIERASLGTWVVITEKISKEIRRVFENSDADEVARIRRAFGDLGQVAVERLVSKGVVKKFSEVSRKRNRWLGHTGYTSEDELGAQIVSLTSDLSDLRQLLGNVWGQLTLVRAGGAKRTRDGFIQNAEVAVGTRSPFITKEFSVGDLMLDSELYLVRDGSQSPLRLGHFVQLRSAPSNAQYTTYFYNRTEGTRIRLVSYQYGPESELHDDVESLRDEFGALGRR